MANKMLIDASHPEETRVVVLKGNRIEEFDFESEHKKQIKGNIYLAKVMRVEPSLQAAFVEYGGNRHGFLAFSEIHPDYYQIPAADRQALVEEDLMRAKEEEEQEERRMTQEPARKPKPKAAEAVNGDESVSAPLDDAFDEEKAAEESNAPEAEGGEPIATDAAPSSTSSDDEGANEPDAESASEASATGESVEVASASVEIDEEQQSSDEIDEDAASESEDTAAEGSPRRGRRHRHRRRGNGAEDDLPGDEEEEVVEELGSQDAMEEVPQRVARPPRKQYKIQEVIKRRQILLVQVVKEERGSKGAALTTYLSLAGRYSVLMPNTARGGGISRKITNVADRKRLKEVVRDLDVPRGMGIILRTAGAMRTKPEVKRDYEYLMRLWETVRTVTLSSMAPALVYEEGSLIKRSIRDLYNKEIDQILVSGETGYREAKDFMRMLLPSQAKVVQPYRESVPIFSRGGIEAQLDRMLQPHVTLRSGGYIIINQTEALVSIDVNSGRSTREHSVEDTALQTNLEAAEEIARQLRLRDLAGLIVIDFIDMEEKRNNRAVEKKIKECLKDDRARIQVGRISHFGLLEMSRQRIRASVLESTTQTCPTCAGMGFIRSNSSLALHVIRSIEEYLQKQATHDIIVKVPTGTALYVLNEKRRTVDELERMYGLRILIQADDSHGHQHVAIEQGAEAAPRPVKTEVVSPLTVVPEELEPEIVVAEEVDEEEISVEAESEQRSDENGRRRRRRRRGRRDAEGDTAQGESEASEEAGDETSVAANSEAEENGDADGAADDEQDGGRKRRRRGRRGGGRRTRDEASVAEHGLDAAFPGSVEASDSVEASNSVEASDSVQTSDDAEEPGILAGTSDNADSAAIGIVQEVTAEAEQAPASEFDSGENTVAPEAVFESSETPAQPIVVESADQDASPEVTATSEEPAGVFTEESKSESATTPELESTSASIELSASEAASEIEQASEPVVEAPKREELLEPLLTSSGDGEDAEAKPKRTGWWAKRSSV